MEYLTPKTMVERFRELGWSYQRIGRFTKLPACTICRIMADSRPHEKTEIKILRGYRKIFRDQK